MRRLRSPSGTMCRGDNRNAGACENGVVGAGLKPAPTRTGYHCTLTFYDRAITVFLSVRLQDCIVLFMCCSSRAKARPALWVSEPLLPNLPPSIVIYFWGAPPGPRKRGLCPLFNPPRTSAVSEPLLPNLPPSIVICFWGTPPGPRKRGLCPFSIPHDRVWRQSPYYPTSDMSIGFPMRRDTRP